MIAEASFSTLIPVQVIGRACIYFVRDLGAVVIFGVSALLGALYTDRSLRKVIQYLYEIGVKCTPVVCLVGWFTGMVLGLQGYHTLSKFSSEGLLGSAVALSLIRELGPVLTAIMVVGQAGSAMGAEIGVQRNSEQIDALNTMHINPLTFLIGPRLIAAICSFPILTAFFDLIGIWGAYVTGVLMLGVDSGIFISGIENSVGWEDVSSGITKSLVFGFLTTLICCYQGYQTHIKSTAPGARGVSQSATRAVVYSCVIILLFDYMITSFLL